MPTPLLSHAPWMAGLGLHSNRVHDTFLPPSCLPDLTKTLNQNKMSTYLILDQAVWQGQ